MVSSFLGGAAGGATVSIIIRAIDNYSKEFNKLDSSIQKQDGFLKKIGNTLTKTGLGYAAVAGAATAFAVSSIKAALESERATQQFNVALGDLADTMLFDLRKASDGMVSNFELINNANKALALGINKNQLVPLMEAAAARSKVFGRTVTEAFNDITIGIGRQSRLILDNLGIILDLDKTYTDYAFTLGKTSEALSDSEKKQAIVNAIIEDTKPLLIAQAFLSETNTEKLQRLGASWANLKENIGLFIIAQYDAISVSKQMETQFQQNLDQATNAPGTYEQTANAFKTLGDEIKGATERSKELLDSLKDISTIVLFGESEKNIEIAQKQLEVDKNRLEVNRLQRFGNKAETFGLSAAEERLKNSQEELDILKLEREIEFNDIKAIEQAKAEAFINEQNGIIQTADEFIKSQETKKQKYFEEKNNVKTLTENQKNLSDSILASGLLTKDTFEKLKNPSYIAEENAIQDVINKTDVLIQKYNEAAKARSGAGVEVSKIKGIAQVALNVVSGVENLTPGLMGVPDFVKNMFGVGDAIIRPNGDIIKTHPNDTLIATQNPGGMGGITINIESVNGLDPDMVAEALQSKLKNVISI